MNFFGTDLAWAGKNPTGICIINQHKEVIYWDALTYSNNEICDLIKQYSPCIVSIDSPLLVQNETGGRTCDSLLMKTRINGRFLKVYATSRQYMLSTFGTIRGEDIYKDLASIQGFKLGHDIVETFPTGIYLSLFPDLFMDKYKRSSKLPLSEILINGSNLLHAIRKLGFIVPELPLATLKTKASYKVYEDMIDGLLCAVNSYYFHHKQVLVFSDDSGYTTLPQARQSQED